MAIRAEAAADKELKAAARGKESARSRVGVRSRQRARDLGTKLAEAVADFIIGDIRKLGWPEGAVLGSEPELLQRYGVSRAVFREAVRLLEYQQVARMRRGPGGGLVVTAPSHESVIDPAAVYLFYANARVAHVTEARVALEEAVAELAPSRLDEEDLVALRELAERERAGTTTDHRELHTMLASITKNPALEIFVGLLSRLTYLYFPDATRIQQRAVKESARAHLGIIDAVVAGDTGLTRQRMRTHLAAEADYLRGRLPRRQRLDASVLRSLDPGSKRAERVARQIFVEVSQAGWPVGQLLGSEAELMERYDVSRAVLREAIRLLEHHEVATMRQGPGGGLIVTKPGVESATGALALLIERWGIQPADLLEVRVAVELAITELAVKRLDDERAAELSRSHDLERQTPADEYAELGHDLHAVLAGLVDNPVFELLSGVLIRLTRMHQDPGPKSMQPVVDASLRAHTGIVEAVMDRDLELARHRMRRHLDALRSFVH